jgi:ABC-2 type transport system permease protein
MEPAGSRLRPKNTGWRLFLQGARARANPRVWGAAREPSWVFFDIVVPLINAAAFVFLYRALRAPEAYIGFIILGATMSTYWINVLWMMASQLYWDKQEGFLELYILSPSSLMAILLGAGVGGLFMSTLRAGAIAILGTWFFGVRMDGSQWALAALVFLVALVALYGLGMLLSSLFLMWGREAWQLSLALMEPVFFLTGMNFPLGQRPVAGHPGAQRRPQRRGLARLLSLGRKRRQGARHDRHRHRLLAPRLRAAQFKTQNSKLKTRKPRFRAWRTPTWTHRARNTARCWGAI